MNCAIRLCPEAHALYAGDFKWWDFYRDDWREYKGMKFSINPVAAERYGVTLLEQEAKEGLGKRGVATANNSGYQAVNLAYLLGAKRIRLIGFDMRDKRGVNHFHGNHSGGTLTNPHRGLYRKWIASFSNIHELLAAEGVELVNCSRESALRIPWEPL